SNQSRPGPPDAGHVPAGLGAEVDGHVEVLDQLLEREPVDGGRDPFLVASELGFQVVDPDAGAIGVVLLQRVEHLVLRLALLLPLLLLPLVAGLRLSGRPLLGGFPHLHLPGPAAKALAQSALADPQRPQPALAAAAPGPQPELTLASF